MHSSEELGEWKEQECDYNMVVIFTVKQLTIPSDVAQAHPHSIQSHSDNETGQEQHRKQRQRHQIHKGVGPDFSIGEDQHYPAVVCCKETEDDP